MRVTAIIAAAGRGERFGGGALKQVVAIGGRPILERSVSTFVDHQSIHEVIVALPPELALQPPGYLRHVSKPMQLVAGVIATRPTTIAVAHPTAVGLPERA